MGILHRFFRTLVGNSQTYPSPSAYDSSFDLVSVRAIDLMRDRLTDHSGDVTMMSAPHAD